MLSRYKNFIRAIVKSGRTVALLGSRSVTVIGPDGIRRRPRESIESLTRHLVLQLPLDV